MAELKLPPPVAHIETGSVYAGEYQEPDVYLSDEQIDRQINDRLDGNLTRVPLYDGAAVLRAVADWAREESTSCGLGMYCKTLDRIEKELRAAADRITQPRD